MLLITSLSMTILLHPLLTPGLADYFFTAQLAIVGLANNKFIADDAGYFSVGAAALEFNPFTHAWSLGVEEQFYFIFPLIVALGFGKQVTNNGPDCTRLVRPGVWLVLAGAASYAISFYWSVWWEDAEEDGVSMPTQPGLLLAFYSLPSRFWQMMTGALLFHFEDLCRRRSLGKGAADEAPGCWVKYALIPLELLTLGALGVSLAFDPMYLGHELGLEGTDFPLPWGMIPVLATCTYIAAGAVPYQRWCCGLPTPLFNWCLAGRLPVYIGKLSYPLYLFHWPAIVMFRQVMGFEEAWIMLTAPQLGARHSRRLVGAGKMTGTSVRVTST